MSREPSLGPRSRASAATTGAQRGAEPRLPLGDQEKGSTVQPEMRASLTDRAADQTQPLRPSMDGGVPALQRELGAHGRETVRRLLDAGLAEFDEAGFQA